MRLHTYTIHQEKQTARGQLQVTFDEDYNLPAYKPDMSSIILKQGHVVIDEVKVSKGHVWVKGTLKFDVLYRAEQNSLGFCSSSGSAVFQETIVLDGAEEFAIPTVRCVLEDLSVHITNSRKLAIRGLIQLEITLSEMQDIEVAADMEQEDGLEVSKRNLSYLQLNVQGKDQCRVHEEMELPGNKLNIQDLIWKDLRLEEVLIQPMSEGLQLNGELSIFVLYQAEPGIRLEWYETRIPIQCRLEAPQMNGEGIVHVTRMDDDWNLVVQDDSEGESRMLVLDGVIRVEYRVYQEEQQTYMQDAYALDQTLILGREKQVLEQLLMKNASRLKLTDSIVLNLGQKEMLQVCHCAGDVQLNRWEVVPNGIQLEGTLTVGVLYLTQEDASPIDAITEQLPFQYRIEAPRIGENCRYDLKETVHSLNVMMKTETLLEVQANLDFDLIVFEKVELDNIVDMNQEPLKLDALLSLPGLTGIRIKPGDTLWDIAKNNHTTIGAILENNQGVKEELEPGMVLLLLKQIK